MSTKRFRAVRKSENEDARALFARSNLGSKVGMRMRLLINLDIS